MKFKMKILVTGAGGFIGYHLTKRLLLDNNNVCGLDNFNEYYDVKLKFSRVEQLGINKNELIYNKLIDNHVNLKFIKLDIKDRTNLQTLFENEKFDIVVNLAAQAGVRYSLENPEEYVNSNIVGFFNILDLCSKFKIKHLIYASSSSVYGNNIKTPFSVDDPVDHPISLYAASKKSNELMAHVYSHLYSLKTTGLRFFTVYGPWGRPDMAYYSFTKSILNQQKINVFNYGNLKRDFTYIDDIIESITRIVNQGDISNNSSTIKSLNSKYYRIFNIGNSNPIKLIDFIQAIENRIGIKAEINFLEMQPGDVNATYADVSALEKEINYKPSTDLQSGIEKFVEWYKNFHK
jgi:UDP-glucuronate 4-epimerase